MDLQHLRSATRPEHEATETAMPLLGPDLTVEAYRAVLRCLLPVLSGWERWSGANAPKRLQPLLAARRRSQWLEQDLRTLRALGAPFPADSAAPGIDWMSVVLDPGEVRERCAPGEFEAGFLGALYTLEGSTLGGRFLAVQVETSLGLAPGQGSAYFRGHGTATGALWRELTGEIAAVPEEHSERLVRAAQRTFTVFREALQRRTPDASLAEPPPLRQEPRGKTAQPAMGVRH